MKMNMNDYLDGEIKRLYTLMTELEPNSEEYGDVESKYLKLMDQKRELEKHKMECKDRAWRNINDGSKWVVTLAVSVGMSFVAYACEAKGWAPFGIGKKWTDKITKF